MKTFYTKQDVLNRLKEAYNIRKDTELAALLGVSKSTLSNWSSRNTIDYDKVFSLCEHINIDWLLTGRGTMLKSEPTPLMGDQDSLKEDDDSPVAVHTDNPKEGIPLIPINAMAGAMMGEQTVMEYECERYVVPLFKGAEFLIQVKGSSMYPKYSSGDVVACKRVPMTDLFFQWNKVYVLDTNQGALIKRIKRGSDADHILIVSDNKDYEPFELPLRCINNVAIVIGVIRLE
mgnify:CR=1 FL=1